MLKFSHHHTYNILEDSPWPGLTSFRAVGALLGLVIWFHLKISIPLLAGFFGTLSLIVSWWRDVVRERTFNGGHRNNTLNLVHVGIILFITSEILFFVSFFWAFFHRRLTPTVELGEYWPPSNTSPFNPFQIPLLNTAILLSSGITVTWAHYAITEKNYKRATQGLIATVLLGVYFTSLQALEYSESAFCIADSVYGATFFIATGFHGLHVIIGTTLLMVSRTRSTGSHFSVGRHVGFEAAAWYWHFVDVVWLFLFVSIYWWGS